MAPGVGKTYQMLEEAHEERDRGRDVVIGYLEPHGRAETLAQAAGLEGVPRRRIPYRGSSLEEMDLPAILRRRAQLCLVDELAHTNVTGCEHPKRYADVEAILAAGTDVYSTVNVQHVESLASQIARLTGAPVKETLPDRVLDDADAVVVVDVTPELLIERLKAGKVYPDQPAAVAAAGYFQPEKLAALRELSLLQAAEEAEPSSALLRQPSLGRRAAKPVLLGGTPPAPSGQRVLVLATPDLGARPTVYHAFRTAERLHAPFDVLWVQPTDVDIAASEENVAALQRLISTLGGNLLVREGEDVVEIAVQVARELRSTYVVIGRPRRRRPLGRLVHHRLALELMSALPGVDVQIVALPDLPRAT